MENRRIILLGGKSLSTDIVFNSIDERFGVLLTIIEKKESTFLFLKRRVKRLGFGTVFGQIVFQILIAKVLGLLSRTRSRQIIAENAMNANSIVENRVKFVDSVNSKETIELLRAFKPDLIIVNGTRIISKTVLAAVDCKFINTHAGITPKYRGVHGTYWALVNNDLKNSGVTVHFVDEGIDTGNIINQSTVLPTDMDNFSTYPLLQLAEGLKILNEAIQDFFENRIVIQPEKTAESILRYHPTAWQYLFFRVTKGVK